MSRPDLDAAVQKLAESNNGRVTPDMIVAAGKADRTGPIGRHFTWEIKQAAEERWLDQARAVLRMVTIRVTTESYGFVVPAYVRDPEQDENRQGYISVFALKDERDLAHEALVSEFSRATAALSRAMNLAQFLGLSDEIQSLKKQIVELSALASQRKQEADKGNGQRGRRPGKPH